MSADSTTSITARSARQFRISSRIQWFDKRLQRGLKIAMSTRLKFVGQLVRDQVVQNLSIPVVKEVSTKAGRRMTRVARDSRSKPGEFPRADTTRLMRDIFCELSKDGKTVWVGTTLDYGLILESKMDRSFLVRTLREMEPDIRNLMTAGISGATWRVVE